LIENLDSKDWKTIIQQIKNGQCIPFLGAGANVRNKNYIGLPVGPKVAMELIKNMEERMFKWYEIPTRDTDLRKELKEKFKISWSSDAEIFMISKKTIILHENRDFISMNLNYNETKVSITYLLCWEKITNNNIGDLISYLNRAYNLDIRKSASMKDYVSNDGKLFDFSNEITLQQYSDELRRSENDIYEFIKKKRIDINEIYKLIFSDDSKHELNVRLETGKGPEVYLPLDIRDPKNLANVSLRYEIKKDRSVLINDLRENILPDYKINPSPLLTDLIEYPFKFIITTNYDRLLERAFEGLEYLFTWEGEKTDDNKLKDYLSREYNFNWIKTAKISKTDTEIKIISENNINFIALNNDKNKVSLKIDDGRSFELLTIMENNHQNIYKYNEKRKKNIKVFVHPKNGYVEGESQKDLDEISEILKSDGCIIYKLHGCFYCRLLRGALLCVDACQRNPGRFVSLGILPALHARFANQFHDNGVAGYLKYPQRYVFFDKTHRAH